MGTQEHKKHGMKKVNIGIITLSSTRTLNEDLSGIWMKQQAESEGHTIMFHEVLPDDADQIRKTVLKRIEEYKPHVMLLTGGTGISPKDVTIEAITPLFKKELKAFSVLFAMLSYEEIGSAAILSRSTAGILQNTIVFCMPGSLNACKLACTKIILPELGHLVKHVSEV